MTNTADNKTLYLNQVGIVCNLGAGVEEVARNLFSTGNPVQYLQQSASYSTGRTLPVGEISTPLADVSIAEEDSRNNRILTTALTPLRSQIEDLKKSYGEDRIGVVIGTSTSGIAEGEFALAAYKEEHEWPSNYNYRTQEISAPSRYVSRWLGLRGPAFSVSSACTSGSKALASAARLIRLGVCDAVIAGGVDSLCKMTIEGFSSLGVTTDKTCNPFSANRDGINIGEGAGVFIMSKEPSDVVLAGWGETSDAYHVSSPDPEGLGAAMAMKKALQCAELEPEAIDYLNFHGTGTLQNDAMEARASHRIFGSDIACGSTKPLTGHTLAAAGAIEAIFCWLALQRDDGLLPPHRWDGQYDKALPILNKIAAPCVQGQLKATISNSFAFGGNNASLILVRKK